MQRPASPSEFPAAFGNTSSASRNHQRGQAFTYDEAGLQAYSRQSATEVSLAVFLSQSNITIFLAPGVSASLRSELVSAIHANLFILCPRGDG